MRRVQSAIKLPFLFFLLVFAHVPLGAWAQESSAGGSPYGGATGGVGIAAGAAGATSSPGQGAPGSPAGTTSSQQPSAQIRPVSPASIISGPQEQEKASGTSDKERAKPRGAVAGQESFDAIGHNEFQDFVAVSAGRILPLYGYNLFTEVPATFAPVDRVPVTPDYVIGPGDEILIRAWGQVDIDYRAVVDRNGMINIPKVGTLNVSSIKYQDLEGYLKTAIGRVFRNFDLTVTLGQLRSIQVFVVGQARRPGSYTVSSLSTLVNTLFASGGPSVKGSMRHIQLKRANQLVTEFDIYDLLLKGDKSKDVQLLPGDVIYIPPIGQLVAISGSVNVPAIYELKDKTSLEDLIGLAGGLTTTAAGRKVIVERILDRKVRKVDEFPLDKTGLARTLRDGDLIQVLSLSLKFDNAVTLRGNVAFPARYPWREGLRIKDIIPDKDALIVPDYWLRQNLAPRVGVSGQQKLRTEVKRALPEINWDYAVIERLKPDDLTTRLIPFNLGKAVLEADPQNNLLLSPGDVITIFSKDDIQVPVAKQTKYVRLEGELANPGLYQPQPGETLRQLVARVGGLTSDAYLYASDFTRESTRILQQKRLDEFVDRLERDVESAASGSAAGALTPEDVASVKTRLEAQRALAQRLRQVKATGRIVLEMTPGATGVKDIPDMALEDGDRLFVPARPSTVSVIGAVYSENAFLFKAGKRVSDYLAQAGGPTRDADKARIFVVRADGSVRSDQDAGLFGMSVEGDRPNPGDTVVVPEDLRKTTFVKDLKDWTQIFYQFGLGAAAIKVIK